MFKNKANQKIVIFAFDTVNGIPKTGDAANITATLSKDGASPGATDDTNPTEIGSGLYAFDMLQAESDADLLALVAESATADISIEPIIIYTVQDILAQLTGTGNRVITIHVQDTDTDPVAEVFVTIGTASQITDTSGNAVFALNDGDYDVILRKDFVTFTVPESLTVSGDGTHNFTGALFVPATPTQPNTCVVFGNVADNGGAPIEDAEIFINTVGSSTFGGVLKIVKDQKAVSGADGVWQLELIRNSQLAPDTAYQVIIVYPSFKFETTITVPDQESVEFSTIVGT